MKKRIIAIVSGLVFTGSAFAQIPNNGFENWTNMGSYSTPDNWGTLNSMTSMMSVYTAEKGQPAPSGSSYLKLTSKTMASTVVNGIAVSGAINTTTMQPVSGFPYTGQPVSLTGKWQYMASSAGFVSVQLTKWNTSTHQRDVVASANHTLVGMAMSWANFTINLSYSSSQVPDSCIIVLSASGSSPSDGDYLWVDNLAFAGSVAGLADLSADSRTLNVYPNPAKETAHVSYATQSAGTSIIEVTSVDGKTIYLAEEKTDAGKMDHTIDTSRFPKGMYTLKVKANGYNAVRQLVIE